MTTLRSLLVPISNGCGSLGSLIGVFETPSLLPFGSRRSVALSGDRPGTYWSGVVGTREFEYHPRVDDTPRRGNSPTRPFGHG